MYTSDQPMHSAYTKIIGSDVAAPLPVGAEPELRSQHGVGRVGVIRSGPRSVVSRAFATSPLRLLTPRNHGHAAWIFTGSYGGGFVDGDSVQLSIDVEPHAAALLSTQASTKVYRSPRGTNTALHATVADHGLLVILPDPVVCFAGSRYRQTQRVELGREATLVLVDWMSSGRRASGERWLFDEYASRLTVVHDGRVVLADALLLSCEHGPLPSRMGRFNVLCVIVLLGPHARQHAERVISQVATQTIQRRADLLLSASTIADGGGLVRIAGTTFEGVAREMRNVLDFLPSLLGDNPW
jgi:urease accessory protein